MDSELGRLGSALSLTEEEEVGLVCPTGLWHTEPLARGFFIVGRLLSSKPFHPEALQTTLRTTFNPVKGMDLKMIEDSRFLLKFFHVVDRDRVLDRCPWAFDKNLLVFAPVDLDSSGEVWGSSVRIRATIDITKLLKRALKIRTVLGDEQLVTFTYERLPNFCYFYGCLGHLSRQCEQQLQEDFHDPGEHTPYGNWLRATASLNYRGRNGGSATRNLGQISRRPTFDISQSEETHTPTPLALVTDLNLVPIPLTDTLSLDYPNPQAPTIVPTLNTHIPHLFPPHSLCTASPPPPPDSASDPLPVIPTKTPCALKKGTYRKRGPTKPALSGPIQPISKKRHLVDENFDEDFVTQGPSKLCRTIEPLMKVTNLEAETAGSPAGCHEFSSLELSRGKSGGLASLWPKQVNVLLQSFSHHHIDVSVQLLDSPFWWRFTGLYGEPDTGQREITWKLLSRLHDQSRRAWFCAGDFNEILDQSEKLGGPPRPMWQIRKFREALEQCELVDLGFAGTPFTWLNRHSEPNTVYERLDRACANLGWSQLFPDTSIEHVPVNCSDHVDLVICLMDKPQYAERSIRPWRFEAAWLQSEQCEGVVEEGWGSCLGQRGVLGVADQIERLYLGSLLGVSNRPQPEAIAKGTEHLRAVVDASMAEELLQPYTATKDHFSCSICFRAWTSNFDNVLLAFELNHFLNTKTQGEQGWMALKLDVSKAYDKVEWSFLEQAVTVWFPYSGEGTPTGGPSLALSFSIMHRVFQFSLTECGKRRAHSGVAVCRGAPTISHLLFADDTLIFSQASPDNCQTIREVLETYREASGQEINFSKSSVTFSRNTREEVCQSLAAELTIRRENKLELYLGLPTRVARSKRDLFATIRDRIWQKITGWNDKLLSQVGKEILIKAVLQAVPSYAMGCFRLPVSLLKELQGMISRFWWSNRDCLLSRVLRARYFPSGDIFSATLGSRPSFTWRSVMAAYDLFRAGCQWRVGSGTQIRIWADPWLPRPRSFRPITPVPSSLTEVRVADLIDHTYNDWNLRLARQILLIWHYSRSGIFLVRSAYHLACSLELRPSSSSSRVLEQSRWRRVWQAKIPNKVKVFAWRACLNALPTGDNLARRIPNTSAECPFCGCSKEDRMHIFVLCPFARQVWGLSSIPLSLTSLQIPDFWAWMQAVAAGLDGVNFGLFLCMCWSIWCVGMNLGILTGAGFQSSSRWTAPPPGCIKLNFDGAIFRKGMELGAGVVARDKDGDCVAWLSRRLTEWEMPKLLRRWLRGRPSIWLCNVGGAR
ncbi:UNVERIFIED_CONTAM: putative mitochondrial protein [Sesamum calycinum]|uniref:Mitochondrial protein n=1 Tax=Sesamum calycinum TaxID=2727403 RepID=A0AAW2MBJ5_9LAMI